MRFYLFSISIDYTTVRKEVLIIMTMMWKNKVLIFSIRKSVSIDINMIIVKLPSFYTSQIFSQRMGFCLRK